MLRLRGGQVESLWDELLPEKLRELPDELAQLDASVRDEALLAPIAAHRDREAQAPGRSAQAHARAPDGRAVAGARAPRRLRRGDADARARRGAAAAPVLARCERRGAGGGSDAPEADPAAGRGAAGRAGAVGEREGAAADALAGAGGQDRLDAARGGRALADRRSTGGRRR